MVKTFTDALMSAEADALCNAEYGQVSDERVNHCNGYRPREWDPRAGTVELAIPKLRTGSYFPAWLLERRRRAEQALISVVATAYLLGVSTRRVEKLAQSLGVTQLSKSQVSVMDLVTLSFVEGKANAALLGPPGVGKRHIAVALAVAACRACYSIYFTSLDDMVRNLKAAETAGRLTNKLGTYLRPGVLVVDEVGYQPLERAEANLVFQVISKRYEKGSIILTSNKTFSEWGQVFGDEVLATAILDRLLHHCEVISINGPSYRLKSRLEAIERENDVA
jgi:DNA replication protein DnaC